jgi:FkbH-like protein
MAQGRVTSALTVREAVRMLQSGPADHDPTGAELTVSLATSFTPLHLEVLLRAYLLQRFPDRTILVDTPPYGDLANGIDALSSRSAAAGGVVVEWQDLDPRLGRRESTSAPIATPDEIADHARARLARIESSLKRAGALRRTVVSLPTLPLAPAYATAAGRVDGLRAALDLALAQFVAACGSLPGVVLTRGAHVSAVPYDARGDVGAGHPYSQEHASLVAKNLADLCFPTPAKKGLITDLDDTLWRGLVGEIGSDAVHWNLDEGSHLHAQYQQLLASLARRGVLIAIASKNDEAVVQRALAREDLLVRSERCFPIVANWGPKSASVGHILKTWNVGADDVVFVDDSSVEVAEVERVHPAVTGRVFPTGSATDLAALLDELNELFWVENTTEEDVIRLDSIRNAALVDEVRESAATSEDFIVSLDGSLLLNPTEGWAEKRALDLVNKTNQFNLNGRRFTASQWREQCTRPRAVNVTASYSDRFGRLGIISVLSGHADGRTLVVDTWVLSCRAFSRGVEQQMLAWLLDQFDTVDLEHVSTPRNGPVTEFLSSAGADFTEAMPRVVAPSDTDSRNLSKFPQITIE